MDISSDGSASTCPQRKGEFDSECLKQLSVILNANGKWQRVADRLGYQQYVPSWAKKADPSRIMFVFSEVSSAHWALTLVIHYLSIAQFMLWLLLPGRQTTQRRHNQSIPRSKWSDSTSLHGRMETKKSMKRIRFVCGFYCLFLTFIFHYFFCVDTNKTISFWLNSSSSLSFRFKYCNFCSWFVTSRTTLQHKSINLSNYSAFYYQSDSYFISFLTLWLSFSTIRST